jgi:L-aspartate semialdehyde sulfurtransferase ferredoxin
MTSLRYQPLNRVRLRLEIPASYYQEPILSRLISEHKLIVNIIEAQLSKNTIESYCEVELRGTPQQINQGLNYLKSLNVQITGKPNTAEEDWY